MSGTLTDIETAEGGQAEESNAKSADPNYALVGQNDGEQQDTAYMKNFSEAPVPRVQFWTGIPNVFRLHEYKTRVAKLKQLIEILHSFDPSKSLNSIHLIICKYEIVLFTLDQKTIARRGKALEMFVNVKNKYLVQKKQQQEKRKSECVVLENPENCENIHENNNIPKKADTPSSTEPGPKVDGDRLRKMGGVPLPIARDSIRLLQIVEAIPEHNRPPSPIKKPRPVSYSEDDLPDTLEEFVINEYRMLNNHLSQEELKVERLELFFGWSRAVVVAIITALMSLISYRLRQGDQNSN